MIYKTLVTPDMFLHSRHGRSRTLTGLAYSTFDDGKYIEKQQSDGCVQWVFCHSMSTDYHIWKKKTIALIILVVKIVLFYWITRRSIVMFHCFDHHYLADMRFLFQTSASVVNLRIYHRLVKIQLHWLVNVGKWLTECTQKMKAVSPKNIHWPCTYSLE